MSVSNVKSSLRENKLFGRVARKKPLVSIRNLVSRLKFAKQHVHKDLRFWQNVLWADESKFNRFASDGKQYVRRPQQGRLKAIGGPRLDLIWGPPFSLVKKLNQILK